VPIDGAVTLSDFDEHPEKRRNIKAKMQRQEMIIDISFLFFIRKNLLFFIFNYE
jgi:hypothetical protein